MSDDETPTGTSTHNVSPRSSGGPQDCGKPGYPECPTQAMLVARAQLIRELAGARPSPAQLRRASEQVDEYLVGVLHAAHALTRG